MLQCLFLTGRESGGHRRILSNQSNAVLMSTQIIVYISA